MTFYSNFSDINGKHYEIEIMSSTPGDDVNLVMGGKPCVIKNATSTLFDPIKSRSCQLNIVTPDWYFDLYEPASRGTSVKIYEYSETAPLHEGKVIFVGYLTPCAYTQTFTNLDVISLNAIDAISSTKDFKWTSNHEYMTFFDIIMQILQPMKYKTLYIPMSYTVVNTTTVNSDTVLHKLYASSDNFVDDDDEHTPWTQYEVLTEIMQFMGWSLVPDGEDIWLIDYKADVSATQNNPLTYKKYNISDKSFIETYSFSTDKIDANLDIAAGGTANVSIDDIYSKISISDNLYNIEDISPDVFDDSIHMSVTDETGLGYQGSKWTRTETKGWLWWKKTNTYVTGQTFQTLCRFKPGSGWKHHFYKTNEVGTRQLTIADEIINGDGTGTWKGKNYHDPSLVGSRYTSGINGIVNTHGCLIQHYAYLKNEGKNKIPSSLDWTDLLTFFCVNDMTPKIENFDKSYLFELPVLEYESTESVNWKPATGTSWITIKGDLYYQYDGVYYDDDNQLTIINKDTLYYATMPVDKAINVDSGNLYHVGRSEGYDTYNTGFSVWKMKLQIGDKYWNGTSWQNDETTFYIKYNDDPTDGNREAMASFGWMSPVNNTSYKDKTGVNGYCIPIAFNDVNAPVMGKMHLTIYTPCQIASEVKDLLQDIWAAVYTDVAWDRMIPIIYCKDFEIGFVYTDTDVWWNNHEDDNTADKVYVGYINEDYKKDFSDLEFKLNTALEEKPISRSFVTTSNGYLKKLKHKYRSTGKAQEYNIIDLYLDHHSDRKPIYEANIHGYYTPDKLFEKTQLEDETLVINTQSWDVAADNNRITLIAF